MAASFPQRRERNIANTTTTTIRAPDGMCFVLVLHLLKPKSLTCQKKTEREREIDQTHYLVAERVLGLAFGCFLCSLSFWVTLLSMFSFFLSLFAIKGLRKKRNRKELEYILFWDLEFEKDWFMGFCYFFCSWISWKGFGKQREVPNQYQK